LDRTWIDDGWYWHESRNGLADMRRRLLLGAAFVAACTGAVGQDDTIAPSLQVATPARGVLTSDATITVSGQASDVGVGLASVTVNGQPAVVDAQGGFSATVPLTPGLAILETLATDRAGNTTRDVRAALAGTLVRADAPVAEAMAARLGPSGFAVLGTLAGRLAGAIDFTAVAQGLNPVFDKGGGGCLSVKVDVIEVAKTGVDVALVPQEGAIGADLAVRDVRVRLRASYRVACIGGSASLTINAQQARFVGALGVGLVGSDVKVSVPASQVSFDGFDLDVGGLPDVIVDLFNGQLGDAVASAMSKMLAKELPPRVESLLANFVGRTVDLNLLGKTVQVTVSPTSILLGAGGLALGVGGKVTVDGAADVEYLGTPGGMAPELLRSMDSFGLAIADDLLNQLLANAWAAGLLEPSLPLGPDHPAHLFFGPEADRIAIELSLPPTVSVATDGELRLLLGDVMVRVMDDDGGKGQLAEIAASFEVPLAVRVGVGGELSLSLEAPKMWAQVLAWREDLPRALTGEQLEALGATAFSQIGAIAGDALGGIPLPSIAGASIDQARVDSASGFMRVSATLSVK
jgi:hypothetical protein